MKEDKKEQERTVGDKIQKLSDIDYSLGKETFRTMTNLLKLKGCFFIAIIGFRKRVEAVRIYSSDKSSKICGTDRIDSKSQCNDGSIVTGTIPPILCSFALDKPPNQNQKSWTQTL